MESLTATQKSCKGLGSDAWLIEVTTASIAMINTAYLRAITNLKL